MENIKKRIAFNKFWDYAFWVTGLLSTFVGLFLLFALMIDLMIDGLPRLSYNFFTSFPSRFPDKAGILSAWVGEHSCAPRNSLFCNTNRYWAPGYILRSMRGRTG